MSSTQEPSTSFSVKEDTETMSNYAESYISDSDVDLEELLNRDMFEKPRGERRWLGKEHHRGKELVHKSVKGRTFIEKTVKSTEPLSKNATKKINASTRDGLDFNVVYSLDKKNRWETADTVSLLGATPENLNAEVVEKDTFGFNNQEKSTIAVHSKHINPKHEPGEFEIRSATSSGKGQNYSNFLPATREFSKKANARMMTIRGEERSTEKESESQPTISYNIYKTHPSQEVVGKQIFKSKVVSKSGRHRPNKRVDLTNYDEYEDEFDYEEEEEGYYPNSSSENVLNLSSLTVGDRQKQERRQKRNDSEHSYSIIDLPEEETEYSSSFNIQEYLREEGYTFEQSEIIFHNQKDNIEHQMRELRKEEKLNIKQLKPRQYLIDVSKWCQLNKEVDDGETTTIIVISHLKKNMYNFLVNSIFPSHPSKRGSEYLRRQISSSMSISEAITKITTAILTNRKIVETMKLASKFHAKRTYQQLLRDHDEWENQMVNMKWPNQHYHSTWANSEELSQVGGKLEWNDLCAMIRKEGKTRLPSDDKCGLCSEPKESHELFSVENRSKTKCSDCLRKEFYREFRAQRIPIDLQTDTADELEYLPTFIPLTVINLYIRMVSETIYKDLGATGDFVKCPSCKSAVFFETIPDSDEKKTQNRSCPCGYSWCKHCDRVPHWPMKCEDLIEWEEKWLLRSTGGWNHLPCCYHDSPYIPRFVIYTDIPKNSTIRASVVEICASARDIRFDENFRNRVINREHVLIRKNIMEKEVVENLFGTSVYLVENVTAWMYMTNQNDKSLNKMLENMLNDRMSLMESLEGEDSEVIRECIKKLRRGIDNVISSVEKKTKTSEKE
uniref:IBR domain-containing protein n=1 Tax=Caenorhabditis tropicalis TaxID=1561998 RepID=A0A1I7TYN3_9PELO